MCKSNAEFVLYDYWYDLSTNNQGPIEDYFVGRFCSEHLLAEIKKRNCHALVVHNLHENAGFTCESELEESRNGYWVIDAQILTSERDSAGNNWVGSVGIPAFYLHENVQGIINEEHAKKIALQILNPLENPYLEFSISATKL